MARNSFKIDKSVSLTPQASAPTVDISNGDMYYDSALSTFRGRVGGNWVDLYSPFSKLVEASAPATPGSGTVYLYAKTDHKLYYKDSLGAETQIGAITASNASTSTTNFNHLLSVTDTTVQIALDTIDDNAMIKATSSTNRAITIFNGTTGQLVQNSLATIDANGTILVPNNQGIDAGTLGQNLYIGATNGIVTIGRAGQVVSILGGLDVAGTLSYLHTTNLQVSDAVMTLNKGGSTAVSGIEIEGTGAVIVGNMLFDNTLTSKWKCGNLGTQYEILTAGTSTVNSHAQTFYSKTVGDALTFTKTTTPTAVSGAYKVYAKDDSIHRLWCTSEYTGQDRPVDAVPDFRLHYQVDSFGLLHMYAGYMRLSNGEILITNTGGNESGTGAGLSDLDIDVNGVYGSAPAANHIYYVYIDRYGLNTSINLADTGLKVKSVGAAGNAAFKIFDDGLSSSPNNLYTPDKVNPYRYLPVGHIATTTTSWNNAFVFPTAQISRDLMSGVFGVTQVAKLNITSTATTSFTHNLGGEPQTIYLSFFDESTNKKYTLDVASYITDKNATTVSFDLTGLSFAGTDNVELVCIYTPQTGDQVASISNRFESPWYTSGSGTQSVAHGLTNVDDIRSYCVLEWDLTGGAPGVRRLLDPTTLVVSVDSTNFNLDWSALSPSATMQYKVISGGTPVPSALPTYMGGYTMFVGGAGGYPTLTAALGAAQAGDSILVTSPQLLTGVISCSLNDIKIEFMPSAYITTPTYGFTFTGNNIVVRNMKMIVTGALTTAFSITSDDSYFENIFINATPGSITNAFVLNSGGDRNWINATVKGTITNKITNSGADNDYTIRG